MLLRHQLADDPAVITAKRIAPQQMTLFIQRQRLLLAAAVLASLATFMALNGSEARRRRVAWDRFRALVERADTVSCTDTLYFVRSKLPVLFSARMPARRMAWTPSSMVTAGARSSRQALANS